MQATTGRVSSCLHSKEGRSAETAAQYYSVGWVVTPKLSTCNGLAWVSQLTGWVGSGHTKCTHGQLCVTLATSIIRKYTVVQSSFSFGDIQQAALLPQAGRNVSRNLVNGCTTVGTSFTANPQRIEETELEHYGRRACSKLCAASYDTSTVVGVVNKLDRRF